MDRTIVYPQSQPRSMDFLQFQKDAVQALGYLTQAAFGTGTCVDGLVAAPTSPASLDITAGTGSIYAVETMDATAYGVLGTDSSTLVKQGLLLSPETLTITPPSTPGYSQVYLVQAAYEDVDGGATVLSYYDADHPDVPFAGPAGAGTSNYTIRQGQCVVGLKAGTAAPTGSQTTPAPDVGYTGLYAVTVAHGATTVTSGDIATIATAPFITLKLPAVPAAIQAQAANYAADSGSANAMAVTLPSYTSVVAGLTLRIKKSASANTTAVTINVNGAGAQTLQWADGTALAAGDWPANAIGAVTFDGSVWELWGVMGPSVFARTVPASLVHYGADAGSANAVSIASVSPSVSSVTTGMQFEVKKIASANTAAMTATICGQSGSVIWADGSAMQAGDWPASAWAVLAWDGTAFRVLSVMGPSVFARFQLFKPSSTVNFYVNASTGNDANDGLTSGTAFQTITGAIASIQGRYVALGTAAVNVADGAYTAFTVSQSGVVNWVFTGNTATPANVTVTSSNAGVNGGFGLTIPAGVSATVQGFEFHSYYSNVQCNAGRLTLYKNSYTAPSQASSGWSSIVSVNNGYIFIWGANTYTGAGYAFVESHVNGSIVAGFGASEAASFTASGTTSFSQGWANVYVCGSIWFDKDNTSFSGTVTGPRYNASVNGVIYTGGASGTFLPGDSSGVTATGGQYA